MIYNVCANQVIKHIDLIKSCSIPHPPRKRANLSKFRTYLRTRSVHRRFPGRQRTVILLDGVQPRFDSPVVASVPFVRQPATVGHRRLLLATIITMYRRRSPVVAQNRGPRRRWSGGRRWRQNVQHHSTAYDACPKLTLTAAVRKYDTYMNGMLTMHHTIANSTLTLKTTIHGGHPGRRRVHRGERIYCFEKFDRKKRRLQYNRLNAFTVNNYWIYGQIRTQSITHARAPRPHVSKQLGTNKRTRPKRNGSHADDWLTHRQWRHAANLRVQLDEAAAANTTTTANHALSSPHSARYAEIETMFRFIAEFDSDTLTTLYVFPWTIYRVSNSSFRINFTFFFFFII